MKPAPFTYHVPDSAEEALRVLAEVGDDGKVLAGGQSLVPILNMRLASPAHLVDINRITGLSTVDTSGSAVTVGATARHADVERDDAAYGVQPLLRKGLRLVAHPAIRNRGTTCGSLAHADPAGEMTAVLALTGGTVRIRSRERVRDVPAEEFFVGPLECCLESGEMVESATFPAFAPGTGSAFVEVARRHGDYALCGVAAAVTVVDGEVTAARAAYISVGPTPLLLDLTDAVAGAPVADADWAAAGRLAREQVSPEADIHATVAYRRQLVGVLTARALAEAAVAPG
ncbi:MAG: FAD binding domain-containing protein [Geodermatophilaceae bacterium]